MAMQKSWAEKQTVLMPQSQYLPGLLVVPSTKIWGVKDNVL
jgi:hypothetical protein